MKQRKSLRLLLDTSSSCEDRRTMAVASPLFELVIFVKLEATHWS